MEALFGRKKDKDRARPRQTSMSSELKSVPYDQAAQSNRPIPVATITQSMRQSGGANISAPITNPTLTQNGTEMNYSRGSRGMGMGDNGRMPSDLPRNSQYSGYSTSSSTGGAATSPSQGTPSWPSGMVIDPSSSSTTLASTRSSSKPDLPTNVSNIMSTISPTHTRSRNSSSDNYPPSASSSSRDTGYRRPTSTTTVRNDANRNSGYAHSTSSSDSHYPHRLLHFHRGGDDEFVFPRPSSAEIDLLFEKVMEARETRMPTSGVDVEAKWKMVYNHEYMRWQEERRNPRFAQGPVMNTALGKDTPEWYLKKFVDQTVTSKQVSSLVVSLRTLPVE